MKKLKVIVIGAGSRGRGYAELMCDSKNLFEISALAEPVEDRREYMKKTHNIPEEMCFDSWEPLLKKDRFADVVIISTLDREHFKPAMAAIEKGYNLLLEKPVAPTPEECIAIRNAANKKGVKVLVCHVLRYTVFFRKIKEMIDNGDLGRIMSIEHDECVGNIHQSHSFVRGNWGNSGKSSCMLLQKCCHDMDILQWLVGKKVKKVQSFGSLTYFTKENAPKGSPERCIDGCPAYDDCYYNAVKLYYDDKENLWFRRAAAKSSTPTDEEVEYALRNTQYGKCVFKCDNDAVDHQVVNLEFEDGTVACFNMNAFNEGDRHIRIMGTKGELYGNMSDTTLTFFDFADRTRTKIEPSKDALGATIVSGHGGGDTGIVDVLYDYVVNDKKDGLLSEIDISVENHMIVFAAEESRKTNTVIDMSEFAKRF